MERLQSESIRPNFNEMIGLTREVIGLPEAMPIEMIPLEGRGSERDFFRLKWDRNQSAILIRYHRKRLENTYYAEIALFLHQIAIPVPRLIHHHPDLCLILMEDLGDKLLYDFRKENWETRKALYQKVLSTIHRLHVFPLKDFPEGKVRMVEGFSTDLYRWERDYFRNYFVRECCGINLEPLFEKELEIELSNLANRLLGSMVTLIHRDLQSQNVMIRNGEVFLIDFQGMRVGNPFYDLGSLLCDPYVNLKEKEREDLLSFYYGLSKWSILWEDFLKYFWEASAQRLMQALGAYGFLGLKKGLKNYLEHIPRGLHLLHLATNQINTLPKLQELALRCQETKDRFDQIKGLIGSEKGRKT
ncbi:MAG: aminoglycoside phosphotransferase family protein [Thermodesulfobacteriota bacterium]